MAGVADARRRGRRRLLPALVVTAIALVIVLVQAGVASGVRPGVAEPVFPTQVAPYSWWTAKLSSSKIDAAAMIYQNGAGVELMDHPQSVLLGADGSVYRRFDAAESMAISEDQGDPAASVLSPDGTFVVVADAARGGGVEVTTLRDGSRRTVDVGEGLSAVPVGIGADGRSVLVLTSDETMSPLHDRDFRLHGDLALLDLPTGAIHGYPGLTDVRAAALSPDGETIVADTGDGLMLVNADTGRVVDTGLSAGYASLDGDAWSPDATRFALLSEGVLRVVDVSQSSPVARELALSGVAYGAAVGWRDAETVLLHSGWEIGDNDSEFSWVDTETGEREAFSSYIPEFPNASLISPDVARDLVSTWRVGARPVDRGGPSLTLTVPLALLLGLAVAAVTPRRRSVDAPEETGHRGE